MGNRVSSSREFRAAGKKNQLFAKKATTLNFQLKDLGFLSLPKGRSWKLGFTSNSQTKRRQPLTSAQIFGYLCCLYDFGICLFKFYALKIIVNPPPPPPSHFMKEFWGEGGDLKIGKTSIFLWVFNVHDMTPPSISPRLWDQNTEPSLNLPYTPASFPPPHQNFNFCFVMSFYALKCQFLFRNVNFCS